MTHGLKRLAVKRFAAIALVGASVLGGLAILLAGWFGWRTLLQDRVSLLLGLVLLGLAAAHGRYPRF